MGVQQGGAGAEPKAPNNLKIASVVGVIALVVAAYMAAPRFPAGGRATGDTAEGVDSRIAPVARLQIASAASGPKVARSGEDVYKGVCAACHATGAAGAPKLGDNGAWGPRLKLGLDGLVKSAIAGKNAMPPRGGNPDVSDLELGRAIAYIANQSGGNLKEPAAPKADAK